MCTLPIKNGIPLRLVVGDIYIILNLIVWYNNISTILRNVINESFFIFSEKLILYFVLFLSCIFSILIGASLTTISNDRKQILLVWSLIGVFSSLAIIVLEIAATFLNVLLLSLLAGISFGLGLPTCMAILADVTTAEKRARFGSIAILLTFLGMFFLRPIMTTNLFWNAFVLAVWRSSVIISVLVIGAYLKNMKHRKNPAMSSILRDRSMLLYLVPWGVFSMVNYLGWPINSKIHGENFVSFSVLVSNVIAGVSTVIAGFVADKIGRKRTLLAGFILYGIGYAVLGINPFNVYTWYLYTFIDGVAWGIFFVVFVFTIWGDLACENASEKYYAIGILPYSLSGFLRVILGPLIADIVSEYAVFSFAAFFLFLAVVPLMFAPETLPERVIRERELKSYIEKAKRVREKFTKS